MKRFEILFMSLEGATIDGLGILTHGGGLVGKVPTLCENLRSVNVVLNHGYTIAQKKGFFNPSCASL
jgi:hypothetical protein